MNFKPFRDYSEHDVSNLFSANVANLAKCTVVRIDGNGFINNASHGLYANMNPATPNVYTPRYEVKAKVRAAVSGERAYGVTLYDVIGTDDFGVQNLLNDETRRMEKQCVVSGMAVPIVRKGLFLVGPFASGYNPAPHTFAVVSGTGGWGIATGATKPATAFGEFIGTKDADGYAPVYIDCDK